MTVGSWSSSWVPPGGCDDVALRLQGDHVAAAVSCVHERKLLAELQHRRRLAAVVRAAGDADLHRLAVLRNLDEPEEVLVRRERPVQRDLLADVVRRDQGTGRRRRRRGRRGRRRGRGGSGKRGRRDDGRHGARCGRGLRDDARRQGRGRGPGGRARTTAVFVFAGGFFAGADGAGAGVGAAAGALSPESCWTNGSLLLKSPNESSCSYRAEPRPGRCREGHPLRPARRRPGQALRTT